MAMAKKLSIELCLSMDLSLRAKRKKVDVHDDWSERSQVLFFL